jgi:hypothetical protein
VRGSSIGSAVIELIVATDIEFDRFLALSLEKRVPILEVDEVAPHVGRLLK